MKPVNLVFSTKMIEIQLINKLSRVSHFNINSSTKLMVYSKLYRLKNSLHPHFMENNNICENYHVYANI